MRVDLIELLRCPRGHEPTPLVTVAYERRDDQLISGSLGCPTCHATFALDNGVAALGTPIGPIGTQDAAPPLSAHRLAALLNLTEPGMRVALCGEYAAAATALESATESLCVAINGSELLPANNVDQLSVTITTTCPVADRAFHALAIDRGHQALLADATRVVRAGGRVIAPHDLAVPNGCRELARDGTEWVAEVTTSPMATSAPVTLRRGSAYG